MRRRQPQQFAHPANRATAGLPIVRLVGGLALLCVVTGCNSFGSTRLVKELQTENARLLTEFRGQRDRAAELEKANRLQAERLAESEKLLARLSQAGGGGRVSSLPQSSQPQSNLPVAGVGGIPANPLTSTPSSNSQNSPAESSEPSGLRWQPRYDSRP